MPRHPRGSVDTESCSGGPEVGESFFVRKSGDSADAKAVATVIAVREVDREGLRKHRAEVEGKHVEDLPIPTGEADQKCLLYYVHYDGTDRRLDEWIERDRFLEPASAENLLDNVAAVGGENGNAGQRYSKLTRSQRRIHEEFNHMQKSYDDMGATTARLEKEHEERTKVKNIESVMLGDQIIDTWYFSPYPGAYGQDPFLYVCQFCLLYFNEVNSFRMHMNVACRERTPPGNEIYRKGNLSVFEVCGHKYQSYAQCLCLLSKLFMDHKTLYMDVDTFLFYILCEVDERGAHIVGHFSKERCTENNLACIMILPPYQRKGYGKLLIQLSYELSLREGWIGTPEKPLSDLGKVSYRSYWWWVLLEVLDRLGLETIRVGHLSEEAGIAKDDIISTLQPMKLVQHYKGEYTVRASRKLIEHCKSLGLCRPPQLRLDPNALRWQPSRQRGPRRKRVLEY